MTSETAYTTTASVPSPAQKAGDFGGSRAITDPDSKQAFPGNLIPASRIAPIAASLLTKVPTAADPTGRQLYALPSHSDISFPTGISATPTRSEERRVGKACRTRRQPTTQ